MTTVCFCFTTLDTTLRIHRPIPGEINIFSPGECFQSIKHIADAAEDLFIMEDWYNFRLDYSKTLRAWFHNFNGNWEKIKSNHYNDRFYRMWEIL